MATLDHIGLNRYIYMSASSETMTLGSHDLSDIRNEHSSSFIGFSLDDTRLLLGINLYNSGPYGYSSWQQLRISENPLSRHLKKNNKFSIVGNPKTRILFKNGKRSVVTQRHGDQLLLDEPAVVSSYKPIILIGETDDYNNDGNFFGNRFIKRISLDNNVSYFTNNEINKIAGVIDKTDDTYNVLKQYYLDENLNSGDSPMSSFEKLIYSQTIYPPQKFTYKSYTRGRDNFNFGWQSVRESRQNHSLFGMIPFPLGMGLIADLIYDGSQHFSFRIRIASTGQSFEAGIENSSWPLDVDLHWKDGGFSVDGNNWDNQEKITRLGIKHTGDHLIVSGAKGITEDNLMPITSSFGLLQNGYSQVAKQLAETGSGTIDLNDKLKPAPFYSRKHGLTLSASTVNPSGPKLIPDACVLPDRNDIHTNYRFGGEAAWDVPAISKLFTGVKMHPFYDSYDEATNDIQNSGKNYSIVPEYRMSDQVERILQAGINAPPSTLFSLTGAGQPRTPGEFATRFPQEPPYFFETVYGSNRKDFYEIYSNSDFLKNFEIILDDHKDFTHPSRIALTCKVFKKFIPYNGFYPCQRTIQLSQQFLQSYMRSIIVSQEAGKYSSNNKPFHAFQNILGPLFGPGVLFNTIKSGIAVDYPVVTGSDASAGEAGDNYYLSVPPNYRVPFEALIEPEKYMSDTVFSNMEPHPSGAISSSAFWNGQGSQLYSRMANNFLAEIPNFFLKNQQITAIASAPQSDPNFGQVKLGRSGLFGNLTTPEVYTMRVKLYRSMSGSNPAFTSADTNHPQMPYIPPQDIIDSGIRETLTMYSRPTAFGPPYAIGSFNADTERRDDNFPDQYLRRSSSASGLLNVVDPIATKGFNYQSTPPYYHGQAWADITFRPEEQKKYTVAEIIASSSVKYCRFDANLYTSNEADASEFLNSIMQINSSVNIFSKGNLGERGTRGSSVTNVQVDDQSKTRWIIQPKFETPVLNFNQHSKTFQWSVNGGNGKVRPTNLAVTDDIDLYPILQRNFDTAGGYQDWVTLPENPSSQSVPIGMWHQYGFEPNKDEGIFLQVTDIPKAWAMGRLGHANTDEEFEKTGSLADLCGFSQLPVKIGQTANSKKISECVVAIPFVDEGGVKKFFEIDREEIQKAMGDNPQSADRDIRAMVEKMQRFIFPPSFDFVNYPLAITPIAMYIFEFSVTLDQQDLSDIWQNVLPKIGRTHETSTAVISHSLIKNNSMLRGRKIREDIRWMVFKVKQRAASRYFDQVFEKQGDKFTDPISRVTTDSAGPLSKIQYNWPYDFFSLVELVKIDAAFEFSDVEDDGQGELVVRPRVAEPENRRVQLNNLFPRDDE